MSVATTAARNKRNAEAAKAKRTAASQPKAVDYSPIVIGDPKGMCIAVTAYTWDAKTKEMTKPRTESAALLHMKGITLPAVKGQTEESGEFFVSKWADVKLALVESDQAHNIGVFAPDTTPEPEPSAPSVDIAALVAALGPEDLKKLIASL